MGIGASIFLIAVGAVLAFAVDTPIAGVDLSTIGWILMAVGGLGLVAILVIMTPRSSHSLLSALAERRRREPPEPEVRHTPAYDSGAQNGYDQRSYDQRSYDQRPGHDQRGYEQRPGYDQRGYDQRPGYGAPAPGYAGAGDVVEYFAGVDAYDREVWVRGRVEHRERRGDAEWLYMRPTHPDASGQPAQPAWVAADQTRHIPRYNDQA